MLTREERVRSDGGTVPRVRRSPVSDVDAPSPRRGAGGREPGAWAELPAWLVPVLVALVLVAAGCSVASPVGGEDPAPPPTTSAGEPSTLPTASLAPSPQPTATPTATATGHGRAPGPLTAPLLPADLLVQRTRPLTREQLRAVRALPGVEHVEPMRLAQVSVENRVLTVAAVDPSSYRRLTPRTTAYDARVWRAVFDGGLAVDRSLRDLVADRSTLQLGNDADATELPVVAVVDQVPQVDVVVDHVWADELGLPQRNALVVSTGSVAPRVVRPRIAGVLGGSTSGSGTTDVGISVLGPDPDLSGVQTALLTGGSVAAAVGSFTYRVLKGGAIEPDPDWVLQHVRTEEVPILGEVTCHEVVLPQLRAALTEIERSGLAAEIRPEQYGGCYQPRFIADTGSLSLHAFGIAIDLNVPDNQRGTVGKIDRRVVAIFQKWGFAWGGDWRWTDPMHFELARLVDPD